MHRLAAVGSQSNSHPAPEFFVAVRKVANIYGRGLHRRNHQMFGDAVFSDWLAGRVVEIEFVFS